MLSHAPEDIAVPVSRNLLFAKSLRKLADRAVQTALKRTGAETFNGLHLRVEEDATSFLKRVRPSISQPMLPFWSLSLLFFRFSVVFSPGSLYCGPLSIVTILLHVHFSLSLIHI